MAQLFIEDNYYEWKGDDGTVVFTRTKNIVNALLYYRNQCLAVIDNCRKQTPRIMAVESFEELMNKIHKIDNIDMKIRKAENMIIQIDDILKRMSINHKPNENTPRRASVDEQPEK